MYLLYTDETNFNKNEGDFFIYGGVGIDINQAPSLSKAIDSLREEYGYRPEDLLKFNTHERPSTIDSEAHKKIKQRVIEEAAAHRVVLFASLILHNIAIDSDEARRKEINRVCFNFDVFLRERNEYGIVLLDTFSDKELQNILREKFSIGLKGLPYSERFRLEQVLGFHLASIGSSNFSSVVDIVLGSLRYAVNALHKPSRQVVARKLLNLLSPLFLRNEGDKIRESSLFFSPLSIRIYNFFKQYRDLQEFLTQNGLPEIETRQVLE